MSTLTDGLRKLADFLDSHPDFEPYDVTLSCWKSAEEFKSLAWQFGTSKKSANDYSMELIKSFSGSDDDYQRGAVKLSMATSRSDVCVRKVVGTKMVEKKDYSNCPTVMVEEEVVEWECSPLLG